VIRRRGQPAPGHRHTLPGQHEHEYEPQYGLPEELPEGEHLLWQGSPDWKALAVRSFHARKLVIYFTVLLAARIGSLVSDGMPVTAALLDSSVLVLLSATAVGLVLFLAWLSGRATVYTLTDKRIVMRIGIVLTVTLNVPLRLLEAAGVNLHSGTTGDISVRLKAPNRFAYLHLWPHARRWHFTRPEPTLLCLPGVQAVAQKLTEAWSAATGEAPQQPAAAPQTESGDLRSTLATN
jgi:hypothetical protein